MANLQPVLHSPMAARAIDTSPKSLGLSTSDRPQSPLSPNRQTRRLSNVVEKTVDKLGKTLNGRTSPGHRRVFSLSRKGKGKEKSAVEGELPTWVRLAKSVKLIDCIRRCAFSLFFKYTFVFATNFTYGGVAQLSLSNTVS